ncbi:2-(1,2-epoxy-1,2-dihydrophenyl)acetyl-CoA isomerase [Anaerospora hongkongensis]|uniref:2-(1,2-epoxy-1,2-dihydrophenyl)acetyl-CoA isomerase n=1 Tax=Anaerospora hongkongensis TaxID=244830 RepID=A0A4R1Q1N0_9FIRM|nr:enoyl-CoA hydratase-related protein [Anaerospora hongkongensis]TCL38864.1 2-(1,2-epoxy-1,2-dihydrophenyl)acetyl-CoA isomerase [Anaerospora hongkongensis]
MLGKSVLFEKKGKVATIALNRPDAMNSMNKDLVVELMAALTSAREDREIRAVVLTGKGKGFCAGGDLFYLRSLSDPIVARNFIKEAGDIISLIMDMEKPVIAMVNGIAAGAGFQLALACDIVFCAKSARFAQSFAKVGLVPDCGGFYLLPRVVGIHKAKELMFTADVIDAEAALSLGIVNKVVDDEALDDSVCKFAARLADGPPIAYDMIKSMVARSDKLDLESTLEYEADLQCICMQTADHKEGVEAFKAKRAPVFQGK